MTDQPTLWHNPRCSKSRQTLALIQEAGVEPQIRLYLDDPPTLDELRDVLAKTGGELSALVRKNEADYKALGFGKETPTEEVLAAMTGHPKLIQRPILLVGDKAAIGRPPESVLTLLEG